MVPFGSHTEAGDFWLLGMQNFMNYVDCYSEYTPICSSFEGASDEIACPNVTSWLKVFQNACDKILCLFPQTKHKSLICHSGGI